MALKSTNISVQTNLTDVMCYYQYKCLCAHVMVTCASVKEEERQNVQTSEEVR